MVDGTIVKVHRHGQSAKGYSKPGHRQVPRRLDDQESSRWPTPSAICWRFELLPGQRYDTMGVAPLIEGVAFGGLIAEKAFDVDWIIAELDERGAQVVISQNPRRTKPRPIDADLYRWRHLIENFFG
jgi:hypothetical protein